MEITTQIKAIHESVTTGMNNQILRSETKLIMDDDFIITLDGQSDLKAGDLIKITVEKA